MISVVLPCFNEEASIQKNIDSIKKELDTYGKDYEIIIVGGAAEKNEAQHIHLQTDNSHNFCNKFSISELFYVFKHTQIAISNDTGAMHLCDAAGTPVIGLFSTKELSPKWYPNNDKSVVIEEETAIYNIDSNRVYEAMHRAAS